MSIKNNGKVIYLTKTSPKSNMHLFDKNNVKTIMNTGRKSCLISHYKMFVYACALKRMYLIQDEQKYTVKVTISTFDNKSNISQENF